MRRGKQSERKKRCIKMGKDFYPADLSKDDDKYGKYLVTWLFSAEFLGANTFPLVQARREVQ